jgi:hypothetical protein
VTTVLVRGFALPDGDRWTTEPVGAHTHQGVEAPGDQRHHEPAGHV